MPVRTWKVRGTVVLALSTVVTWWDAFASSLPSASWPLISTVQRGQQECLSVCECERGSVGWMHKIWCIECRLCYCVKETEGGKGQPGCHREPEAWQRSTCHSMCPWGLRADGRTKYGGTEMVCVCVCVFMCVFCVCKNYSFTKNNK